MPTLPRYDAQMNVKSTPISPAMEGRDAELNALSKLGQTLESVNTQWRDANDVMEYTKFKANAEMEVATIKAEAEADPDENNTATYVKKLEKSKSKLASGFSNKMVEQKAMFEMDSMITLAGIDIDTSFKKKQLLTNELKLDENVKLMAQKRNSAATPEARTAVDTEMMELIKVNINTGTITQAGGRKRLDDYRTGHVDLAIMNDAAMTKEDSYVYQQLKAGDNGEYPDLSDSERADRLEKVELHIRRNKALADYGSTINQDANEKDLLKKHGTNNVTEGDVRNLLISTGVRKDFGEKYMKSIYELPAQQTEHAAYNKIKMAQLNGKSDKEINSMIIDNVGLLTTEDRDKLVDSKYNALDSKTIVYRASAEALKKWADDSYTSLILGDLATNEILFNFYQRVEQSGGEDIDKIMQNVQKDYIKKANPDTTMLPDVPNLIGNRNRIVSVYKKESKAKGQKADLKPVNPVTQTTVINFDDL